MWSYQPQSGSDYLVAVLPANGQELNPAPAGSYNHPWNQAGSHAPNATWAGFYDRSLDPSGPHAPNPTLTGSESHSLNLTGGHAINRTYGIPMMVSPVTNVCPLFPPAGETGSLYQPLFQYSGQPVYGSPFYHYQTYPYQHPPYAPGYYSYPPQYTYPHQYQPFTYAFPYQYSTYPDESYENSRYSGPAQFSGYADVKNEYTRYPSPRQSSQSDEYFETEGVQSSTSSTVEPPMDGRRSFGCAFCRFRAENESLFRSHNNSCKGPKKERVKYKTLPPRAK